MLELRCKATPSVTLSRATSPMLRVGEGLTAGSGA
jgi:hypothetical protein